ncbi:MAG: glycoside hydrolase family 2, partial [Bacteroidales bacterium]|nr:glycoside hydrolase family 2 [Bacteroidales bacterium]
ADNQTLKDADGEVEVIDVESGKTIYNGSFTAAANTATLIKKIPARKGQGMLLIRYRLEGGDFANHYLYGEPPYNLEDYRSWINKTGIYETR